MTNDELKEELEHLNRKGALPPVFTGRRIALPTMNINSSSNGLSWTAPVPQFFFVCFVLFCFFFFFFVFSPFFLSVCAFERQTKFVKS